MNTPLFKSKMKIFNDTQESLATAMGMKQSAINMRINGKTEFRQNEINFVRNRYNLTDQETIDIFFTKVVSN